MSVSSSNQSSGKVSSNTMTHREFLDEPGVCAFDSEFETDTTSGSWTFSYSSWSYDDVTSNATSMKYTSSSVFGTYTIDDELEIETMSGGVDIMLNIDLSTSLRSTPVTVRINTKSGDIKVRGQLTGTALQPPHRLCIINLHTMSGSISADLPISTSTTIMSMSGTISANLHPINPKVPSDISLRNISGRTKLDVNPSILDPLAPLRLLSTTVDSTSGSARLTYPTNWEGKIEGKVGRQGSVKPYWPGLLVAREGSHMTATNGHGAGKLSISGVIVAVEIFGKDYRTDDRKKREIASREHESDSKAFPVGHTAQKRKRTEMESQELENESNPAQKRDRYETKGQGLHGVSAQKRKRCELEGHELQNETKTSQKRQRCGKQSQEPQMTLPLRQR